MKKYSFLLPITLTLLIACSKPPSAPLPPSPVTVVQPTVKNVHLFLEYIGHIMPNETVNVTSQIAGQLVEVNFTEGQEVIKDQLIFVIDPRPYQAALKKAEGVFAQTLANLNYNEETVQRYSQLVQNDYVSQLNYDQYRTNVLVDEATIKQNIADIENAKLNLDYCYIRAPFDSIAGSQMIDIGNYITVGGNNPLVVLNQVTPISASFYIPERDLPKIQELQRQDLDCKLKVQAFVDRDLKKPNEGVLTVIDNQVQQSTGSILLKAEFPNKDKILWPGQFADIKLYLGVKKDAMLLPTQAVQISMNGHYVFVVKDDSTVELRTIQVGQKEGDNTIIESGITPLEKVVLKGQLYLSPGQKVTVVPDSKAGAKQ